MSAVFSHASHLRIPLEMLPVVFLPGYILVKMLIIVLELLWLLLVIFLNKIFNIVDLRWSEQISFFQQACERVGSGSSVGNRLRSGNWRIDSTYETSNESAATQTMTHCPIMWLPTLSKISSTSASPSSTPYLLRSHTYLYGKPKLITLPPQTTSKLYIL